MAVKDDYGPVVHSTGPLFIFFDGGGMEKISGVVRAIPFDWGETCVLNLSGGTSVKHRGPSSQFSLGTEYQFMGDWTVYRGKQQFVSIDAFELPPDTINGLKRFFQKAPGIGPSKAAKLANHLSDIANQEGISILDAMKRPELVGGTDDLLPAEASAMVDMMKEWAKGSTGEQRVKLWGLMAPIGVRASTVDDCISKLGDSAYDRIRDNPFVMLDKEISGVGFTRADSMFRQLGGNPEDECRLKHACNYYISNYRGPDTWLDKAQLMKALSESGVDPERVLKYGSDHDIIVRSGDYFTSKTRMMCEQIIADKVRSIRQLPPHWPDIADHDISDLEGKQLDAIKMVMANRISIILGVPGTGKTFTAGKIWQKVVESVGSDGSACICPTGKSAVVLTSSLDGIDIARTAYSRLLLSKNGDRLKSSLEQRDAPSYVLMDEVSMYDTEQMAAIMEVLPDDVHIIMVGDDAQLEPVSHGSPLRDLIKAGVPHVVLDEVRRNSGEGVRACIEIKSGNDLYLPPQKYSLQGSSTESNTKVILTPSDSVGIPRVMKELELVQKSAPELLESVQVLCVTNKSRKELNNRIRTIMNPAAKGKFSVGDRVIVLSNGMYPVPDSRERAYAANGDIGKITFENRSVYHVELDPDRTIVIFKVDDSKIDLAYAITIHKSQGSQARYVITMLEDNSQLLGRELLYTAVSRFQESQLIITKLSVWRDAIRQVRLEKRKTRLKEMLDGTFETIPVYDSGGHKGAAPVCVRGVSNDGEDPFGEDDPYNPQNW